ncbi:hypothetical protein PCASD_07363 [Puccinia coronata f. sp. avenae]|uniref:Uncharacterized protein n=1 Tax=Puccinia coronata f. sp. avenae TaxID=200324 RepID=A0A2N5SCH1_9BASI|nr:hypothetical protein PCASD_20159 [Puccinia coronata f. sp. avenae]PLW40810.1 hypothetical protein PCASD_07363 [Puccinia coronata f. sp. avenae]
MVSEALLDPLELSGRIPDFQKAVPHPDPIRGVFKNGSHRFKNCSVESLGQSVLLRH